MRTMRNKKHMLLIVIILALGVFSEGKRIGTFPNDFFKMPILRLDDNIICVIDRGLLKGHIYDRKTLKKIAEFGRAGQGPGEFLAITHAIIDKNYIYISSFPKLCIFSKQGKFIKEFRVPIKTGRFMPLGNTFVATYFCPSKPGGIRAKYQYQLFDENLKLVKSFFDSEFHTYFQIVNGYETSYLFKDCEEAVVYKNRVYIGNTDKGFYFAVCDQNGEKLYEIKRDEKKRILTGKEKENILEFFKTSGPIWGKGKYPGRKLVIRDIIPAYEAFFVNDDRIYVFTYPKNSAWYEIIILDLKGNLLKYKKISLKDFVGDVGTTYCCMDKGKLYFVKDGGGLFDSGTEFHEFEIWER